MLSRSFLRDTPNSSLGLNIIIKRNEYSVSETLVVAECFPTLAR